MLENLKEHEPVRSDPEPASTRHLNRYPGRIVTLSLLVAMAVVLHRMEALLPLPSPWIKLGLANIITLITLAFIGFREALIVTLLRIFIGSVIGGTFLSPTFFLSLVGGMAGTFAMALVYRRGRGPFSLIGVSVLGAYIHTGVIFLCVHLLLIPQQAFLRLLPVFLLWAMLTGLLTGVAANTLKNRLEQEGVSLK